MRALRQGPLSALCKLNKQHLKLTKRPAQRSHTQIAYCPTAVTQPACVSDRAKIGRLRSRNHRREAAVSDLQC
jgi:hypothetical protein